MSWLEARDVEFYSKTTAVDLVIKILTIIEDNDGVVPPIISNPYETSPIEQIISIMRSLYCMNARIMVHGLVDGDQLHDLD